jgi:SAM-dependent methyltransferase
MTSIPAVSNPLFARVWTVMSAHETEELTRLRRENLAGLSGRVLEVGAGTGTNFALYPATVTHVVAVEPEAALFGHAQAAAATAPFRSPCGANLSKRLPVWTANLSTRWSARWCCAPSTNLKLLSSNYFPS